MIHRSRRESQAAVAGPADPHRLTIGGIERHGRQVLDGGLGLEAADLNHVLTGLEALDIAQSLGEHVSRARHADRAK